VQTIRQLEAVLHREWQQLSQQDIRRLTGGMRRRVEAIIQASQYHKTSFCSKTCPF
jgi:isopentenyl phosphate kinase